MNVYRLPREVEEELSRNEQDRFTRHWYLNALDRMREHLKWQEKSPIFQALMQEALDETKKEWDFPEVVDLKGLTLDEAYERMMDK